MKWQDVAAVGGTAVATALVAVAIFWTGQATATEGQTAEIPWPVLRSRGCEITLRTEQAAYQPGDSPVVKLEAVNPTDSSLSLRATLVMMAQPQASPMSRRMPISRQVWEHECELVLQAGERKTFSIPTNVRVGKNTRVFFQLRVGKATVSTRPMAVGAPVIMSVPRQAAPSSQGQPLPRGGRR